MAGKEMRHAANRGLDIRGQTGQRAAASGPATADLRNPSQVRAGAKTEHAMAIDNPHMTPDHEAFARTVRTFVSREIAPQIDAWEQAESFPRDLYAKAAAAGLLSLGFPAELGGVPGDVWYRVVATRELARAGSGGLLAGLMSHTIALPPICALGSPELQQRVIPKVLEGRAIAALAVTEPSGGSDVANLQTKAERDGDDYVLHGSKVFITSGVRADFLTVAVRTGGAGAGGVSLILVEGDCAGLHRTPMKKMGWWCSDTATIYFDGCRVPASNLIGSEGLGFLGLMHNFNGERLGLAATAWAFAEVCLEDAVAYARERHTFGKPLLQRQVIRHKLVDMATRVEAARALLFDVAWQVEKGLEPVAQVCMCKNFATETLEYVAGEAVQILGGAGYTRGARIERIFRETKVLSIGGGASEVLKDLAARQLGY